MPRDTDNRIAGRALFGIGLGLWVWRSAHLLPYGFHDLHYLFSLEWGFMGPVEWVHPLFVLGLDLARFLLGLAGHSGKMLLPLGIINLTAGVLTLTGLFLLAERIGRDSLLSAAGVLCLAFGRGFWEGALRPDPYSLAAAGTVMTLALLLGFGPVRSPRWYAMAGISAGLTCALHASALALAPVAALAAWREGLSPRRTMRLLAWFAAGMAGALAAGFAALFIHYGIDLEYFKLMDFLDTFHKIEQMPQSSLYTSGSPLKQLRDLFHNYHIGGSLTLITLSMLALGSAVLARRRKPGLSEVSRRAAILASANFVFFALFFFINNSHNGFVYSSVLGLPLLLTALLPRKGLVRYGAAAVVLVGAVSGARDRLPDGPKGDPLFVEARHLDALLAPGDVLLLPGCAFPEIHYQRRFNIIRSPSLGRAADCLDPAVGSSLLRERLSDILSRGRSVYLPAGAFESDSLGLGRDSAGDQKRRQIFTTPPGDAKTVRAYLAAVRGTIDRSFSMLCENRSPSGRDYCRLRLKSGPAAPTRRSGPSPEELEDLIGALMAGSEAFLKRRIIHIVDWIAESPDDVYALYDLVSLAAGGHGRRLRETLAKAFWAERVTGEMARRFPGNAGIQTDHASLLMTQGRRAEARRALDRAASSGPAQRDALRIGRIYHALGDYEKADRFSGEISRLQSRNVGLKIRRAELLLNTGRKTAALKVLVRAEGLSPLPNELRQIARVYRKLDEKKRSRGALESALGALPGIAAGAADELERAEIHLELGSRRSALTALARANSLKPGEAELIWMKDIYRKLGRPRRAIDIMNRLAETHLDRASFHVESAELHIELGQRENALKALKWGLALDPTPDELRRAARCYQVLGRCPDALTLWKGLVSRAEPLAKDLSDKAVCEFISGNWQAAVSDLKKAIALDPRGLEAYLSLGVIYGSRGLDRRALEVYGRALAVEARPDANRVRDQIRDSREALRRRIDARGVRGG